MQVTPYRRLRAILALTGTAVLAGTFMLGASAALAAPAEKVAVCHLDRTAGTFTIINVATKAGVVRLAKGDYLADTTLAGKSVYAAAWTETDGAAGYSGCDTLIAAVVEDSGDGAMSAGDLLVYGKYPTAFDAPYAFASFAEVPKAILGITACESPGVAVDLGGGAVAMFSSNINTQYFYEFADEGGTMLVGIRDVVQWDHTAGGYNDFIVVSAATFEAADGSPEGDAFIDVSLSPCPV